MFARLGARAILLAAATAFAFFGIGLIGFGIAASLTPYVGSAWGNVIAGAIFLLPPLIWAIAVVSVPPRRRPIDRAGTGPLMTAIIAALAKETPWVAVVGAGLAGVLDLFLSRNKSRK
jgi:uncharacterized membrane protein